MTTDHRKTTDHRRALVDAKVLQTRRVQLVALSWSEALRALRVHVETYCDPQWWSERDARALEELAGEVRARAEFARDEREPRMARMSTDFTKSTDRERTARD